MNNVNCTISNKSTNTIITLGSQTLELNNCNISNSNSSKSAATKPLIQYFGAAQITINGGTYTTYDGGYVMNALQDPLDISGCCITINDGTFNGYIKTSSGINATANATLIIKAGTFEKDIWAYGTNFNCYIYGGTFKGIIYLDNSETNFLYVYGLDEGTTSLTVHSETYYYNKGQIKFLAEGFNEPTRSSNTCTYTRITEEQA
jgi:hypothetical protein